MTKIKAISEHGQPTRWREWSDEQLVTEYQLAEDVAAFSELMERYRRPLRAYLKGILGNEASAEDVLQNTFLQLHLRVDTIDTSRRFRPWLYMVARNQALDYLRRNRRHQAISLNGLTRAEESRHGDWLNDRALSDSLPSPQQAAEAQEVREWIQREADAMSESLQEVFVRTYIRGLKLRETAEELGLPMGTVKSRIHAARAHLQKRLRPEDN